MSKETTVSEDINIGSGETNVDVLFCYQARENFVKKPGGATSITRIDDLSPIHEKNRIREPDRSS